MEIARGAEAVITLDGGKVIKSRTEKSYRNPEIDIYLRKTRAKVEASILEKLSGLPVPRVISLKDSTIVMEHIDGRKLTTQDARDFSGQIGSLIGKVHEKGIIHGDLTTSNMILKDGTVYLIDFGLSYHSRKAEDRAADLHVLHETLKGDKSAFMDILKFYTPGFREEVVGRLHSVESRGRNKKQD